jgi:diketogulonate reductase-like aldo/keto reductase
MRRVVSRTGARLPVLGQGTWTVGDDPARRSEEVRALRLGLDLGMNMVDTAEMYGDGRAEELVAEALAGRRDEVFLVSKVLPENASREGTLRACERSLRRLRTDRLDLYLLHWEGPHPLADTVAAFEQLVAEGKVLHYGVSNFDVDRMQELERLPGGRRTAADQVLYGLPHRGVERNLLPWCQAHGVVLMAYSPLEQGRLEWTGALAEVGARHGVTPAQVALAWVLRHEHVVAVPKAAREEHVRQNAQAAELTLSAEDLADLDRAYPAPPSDVALEML